MEQDLLQIFDLMCAFNKKYVGQFQVDWVLRPADFPVLVANGDSKIINVEENGKS